MATHNRRDIALKITKACPAANANHNSGTLDLGKAGNAVLDHVELEIAIPALPSLAADKNLTVKLQDSADDSTYADLVGAPSVVVTGVSTSGSAAKTVTVRLPSITKRYLQANLAVDASGGDNTAKSVALQLLV